MCKVHIARAAAFGDVCSQIHLGLYSTAGIQHVANLQQGQFGDANARGVSEPQQHHVTLRQTASDGCNADQVLKLSRAEGSSSAGCHTGSLSGLHGNRAGSGESQAVAS